MKGGSNIRTKVSKVQSQKRLKARPQSDIFSRFDQLNGDHPWMQAVPNGFVAYPVRRLKSGTVLYFNFKLAKEMGLVPKDHPEKLTLPLKEKILEIFCQQIINEYDRERRTPASNELQKEGEFMATRYLQLQHKNKRGTTSGDGRSIWNGVVKSGTKIWDVSSRGTGVTRLAPGAVEANRPLKTGNRQFGYGCGLAELDELIATLLMSETFYNHQIPTERTLAIIDLGHGLGIGVRAAPNLIRPAHLFIHLKQNNYESLKSATDYLIDRQIKNGKWTVQANQGNRYDAMLGHLTLGFAQFVARLEREYIFHWLDWDGDNVLADPGIIDYGSLRQMGLRHDQYRYDDIDRYSTNLNEQKSKAKVILRTFAQLVDFLKCGKKRGLDAFQNAPCLKLFDLEFDKWCTIYFLQQAGFDEDMSITLYKRVPDLVKDLYRSYTLLEKVKTHRKALTVADGVNRPAIFNMRRLFPFVADHLLKHCDQAHIPAMDLRVLFKVVLAKKATRRDRKIKKSLLKRLDHISTTYQILIGEVCKNSKVGPFGNLRRVAERVHRQTSWANRAHRMTGNSVTIVVDEILQAFKRGLPPEKVQTIMDLFVRTQSYDLSQLKGQLTLLSGKEMVGLWSSIQEVLSEYSEDI